MSDGVIPIVSIDQNDNVVIHLSLKMGNFEIEPSHGGVLENGLPFTTAPDPRHFPLGRFYSTVKIPVPSGWAFGSTNLAATIDKTTNSKFAFVLDPDGGVPVQPGTFGFFEPFNFVLTIMNISPATLTALYDETFCYVNSSGTGQVLVDITNVAILNPITAQVTFNVRFNSLAGTSWQTWQQPGDATIFVEFET